MAADVTPEIVPGDPVLRRKALAVGAGVVIALLVAMVSARDLLGSLSALSQTSPGEALLWFGAFMVPILALAIVVGAEALRRSLATLRQGRFPPSGMPMLRDTPVLRGRLARIIGILGCTLGATLLVVTLLLGWMSYRVGAVLWYGCPKATRPA
jgi:hypothetical protein